MHNINKKHVNETTDLLVINHNSRTYMVFISENRFNIGYKKISARMSFSRFTRVNKKPKCMSNGTNRTYTFNIK